MLHYHPFFAVKFFIPLLPISSHSRAKCPEETNLFFYSLFSPAEFHAAASNLSSSTVTGPDKVAYPMLKHLPSSGINFLHICNLSFTFFSSYLEDIFYYSHPQDGKASRLSCFLPAYLSHLLRIKAFEMHYTILSTLLFGV